MSNGKTSKTMGNYHTIRVNIEKKGKNKKEI